MMRHRLPLPRARLHAALWLAVLAMPAASSQAVAQAAPAPKPAASAAANRVEAPRPHAGDVMRHWPTYPEDARAAGQEGTVVVTLRVTRTGEPEDIRVQRSSSVVSLDVAAVSAISRWRFEPGKRNGVPEDMTVSLPIRFTLPPAPEAPAQK